MKFGIGQPVTRAEDRRFLTGRGRYVDDVVLPNQVWGIVLRSPHAAARIVRIATAAARNAPGVLLVLTGEDLDAAGLGSIACNVSPIVVGGKPPRYWPK